MLSKSLVHPGTGSVKKENDSHAFKLKELEASEGIPEAVRECISSSTRKARGHKYSLIDPTSSTRHYIYLQLRKLPGNLAPNNGIYSNWFLKDRWLTQSLTQGGSVGDLGLEVI